MTSGTLKLTSGVISAHIDGHTVTTFDAAVSGKFAGVEFALDEGAVHIGPQNDRRAPLTLSVSMHPGHMEQMLVALANALDMPAFTKGEWLEIAGALACLHASNLDGFVERIRAAYQDPSE